MRCNRLQRACLLLGKRSVPAAEVDEAVVAQFHRADMCGDEGRT
jgi:hypothetical protein